jgi:SAM-dependent methyltransferase
MSEFVFVCPLCHIRLESTGADEFYCPVDNNVYRRVDGIWRFLPSEREQHFKTFVQDYERIRHAEGRGADDPRWYRALPFEDRSRRFSGDWKIRAKSCQALLEQVIAPLEYNRSSTLKIADVGAGIGWLSNRLTERGHTVAAVDLLVNDFDGLGAHIHYETPFTPVQAEFDALPFEAGQFDLVIFNAALHYAPNSETTLNEALRVLRSGGLPVIMDTPVYHDAASGAQMVQEREAHFQREYGTPSNSLPSENYLTYDRLDELGAALGLRWRLFTPDYGWRWRLRPLRAKLRGHREPAKFHVIVGERV